MVWSRSAFVLILIRTTLVVTFLKVLLLRTFRMVQPIGVVGVVLVVRQVSTTCAMCLPDTTAAEEGTLMVLVVSSQTK